MEKEKDTISAVDVQNGNALIAAFMGFKKRMGENDHFKVPEVEELKYQAIHLSLKNMPYHSSWDWLHPAWVKLREIQFSETSISAIHTNAIARIAQKISYGTIEEAWSAIVNGIKWYNQNKKSWTS